jgi:hypothetical protein
MINTAPTEQPADGSRELKRKMVAMMMMIRTARWLTL